MEKLMLYGKTEHLRRLTELIRETKELIEDSHKLTDSFTLTEYGLTVYELKKGLERELQLLERERQEHAQKYEIH